MRTFAFGAVLFSAWVCVANSGYAGIFGNQIQKMEDVGKVEITSLCVRSKICNRFAGTMVKSVVENTAKVAKNASFFMVMPERAYVVSFIMEVDGKNYTAFVEGRDKAEKTYEYAQSGGWGAALISVSPRDSNVFNIQVNVQPATVATFYLTYDELLERRNGQYEHVINVHPMQLVKQLLVEVKIAESRPLVFVTTPSIRGREIQEEKKELDPLALISRPHPNRATVVFNPGVEEQRRIAKNMGTVEEEGMAGQFVVQYEVEREPFGGQILVNDGYFVHFFTPSDLDAMRKHIVFVLDSSGSMFGDNMKQLKNAMMTILGQLRDGDYFNLVQFNHVTHTWNLDTPTASRVFPKPSKNKRWYLLDHEIEGVAFPPAYPVNPTTIQKAKRVVGKMAAAGATNICEALRVGIHLVKLRRKKVSTTNVQPIIFFLTDGQSNRGQTLPHLINSKITSENTVGVPIVSLSFGEEADQELLEEISLNNNGFTKHIYAESDASKQLENFYKEISLPLLSQVKFIYGKSAVNVTKTKFSVLYQGSEFVVAGRLPDYNFKATPTVESWGPTGLRVLEPYINVTMNNLDRLWAFMTVKKYLEDTIIDPRKATLFEQMALKLALQYSFVTPLTSLVVVSPAYKYALDIRALSGNTGVELGSRLGEAGEEEEEVLSGAAMDSGEITFVPDSSEAFVLLPPKLHEKLPWLQQQFRSDESLKFLEGSYTLGLDQTSPSNQTCTTHDSEEGLCKLLLDCEQLYPVLTDPEAFVGSFCGIEHRFAGVCCP